MLSKQEKQDIVEFVCLWMSTQGLGSRNMIDGLGRMCSVGCLSFESDGTLGAGNRALCSDFNFCRDLMEAHDSASEVEFSGAEPFGLFARYMENLCESHGLTYPEWILG